jgi:hypothetical protein
VAASVFTAGGTLVAAYPQIGVAIASSTSPTFRTNLLRDVRVENASATTGPGYKLDTGVAAPGPRPAAALPNAPASDSDPHHFSVTNNSYFADPYLFNCHNDVTQRAIWTAESRATRFALDQGVAVVAAAGNFADDLAHPTQDIISPDTGPGEVRSIRTSSSRMAAT